MASSSMSVVGSPSPICKLLVTASMDLPTTLLSDERDKWKMSAKLLWGSPPNQRMSTFPLRYEVSCPLLFGLRSRIIDCFHIGATEILQWTMSKNSNSDIHNGLIALLDLPKYSRLGLDGQVIVLQTNEFVGIEDVPSNHFHLVTAVSAGSLTVGFIIRNNDPVQLIRRYSPQTEEVSESLVDDVTVQSLLHQVHSRQIPPSRLLRYSDVVSGQPGNGKQQSQTTNWKEETKYINQSRILELRGLVSGDKIVPGSYNPDNEIIPAKLDIATTTASKSDGKSVEYPPIPVINTKLSLVTHKHSGTRQFLAQLSPDRRTQLFLLDDEEGQDFLLRHILQEYYQSSWKALLGDLQLSFCLFFYLQCLSSLEHWKDLISLLAFNAANASRKEQYAELFQGLLEVLPYQLSGMDPGFLEDLDEAGGNFLLPSLELLRRNLCFHNTVDHAVASNFQFVLESKFPQTFSGSSMRIEKLPSDARDEDFEMGENKVVIVDEDGPVVVDSEEIKTSLARSAGKSFNQNGKSDTPMEIMRAYPLLVAAIQPHEDVLMTCARALDEKNDVGLVREAAAYLEEIEQNTPKD
jgi:hypothetical protein